MVLLEGGLLLRFKIMINDDGDPRCHAGDLSRVCVVTAGLSCAHWLLNVQGCAVSPSSRVQSV